MYYCLKAYAAPAGKVRQPQSGAFEDCKDGSRLGVTKHIKSLKAYVAITFES